MEEKTDLELLKENYFEIQGKYGLPEFDKLNRDFQIEKIAENETDFLIREIRKFIADKLSNYLRFIELILHPANAPMFVFSVIKTIGSEEKKKLNAIYRKLSKSEVQLIELDIEFNEEKEVNFVKESYIIWQDVKKDVLEVVDVIKKNWDNKTEVNGKNYFG
jgi:hypothetical protein